MRELSHQRALSNLAFALDLTSTTLCVKDLIVSVAEGKELEKKLKESNLNLTEMHKNHQEMLKNENELMVRYFSKEVVTSYDRFTKFSKK